MKLILFILLALSFQALAQDDDCIFDRKTQTDEFIKDIAEFKNYTWDDTKKAATIILASGDTLIAHRGGCYHFGISGALSISGKKLKDISQDYIIEKGIWMAQNLFENSDLNQLRDKIQTKDYEIRRNDETLFVLSFNHEYYTQYYLRAEQFENYIVVEISFYYG